ncbi:hypothetical protein DEFDS_P220 (plasmid) [Deferribacter desulfuricans SSM1]|uniref:Uncharacterized protein n=1 Tax=Deferribacter desulfuricans (strain DSM 14783 / JCM 11476 / NBRC 101012 / SSM1) TaxID=639282 RepID=D3PF48_DEFDS|nr:hypothetical protein [Deferribacter desulfuricans]BAI81840.1 hypothetical protein DEFDS_P220 [Deferribacter desulfuricans SSM1]
MRNTDSKLNCNNSINLADIVCREYKKAFAKILDDVPEYITDDSLIQKFLSLYNTIISNQNENYINLDSALRSIDSEQLNISKNEKSKFKFIDSCVNMYFPVYIDTVFSKEAKDYLRVYISLFTFHDTFYTINHLIVNHIYKHVVYHLKEKQEQEVNFDRVFDDLVFTLRDEIPVDNLIIYLRDLIDWLTALGLKNSNSKLFILVTNLLDLMREYSKRLDSELEDIVSLDNLIDENASKEITIKKDILAACHFFIITFFLYIVFNYLFNLILFIHHHFVFINNYISFIGSALENYFKLIKTIPSNNLQQEIFVYLTGESLGNYLKIALLYQLKNIGLKQYIGSDFFKFVNGVELIFLLYYILNEIIINAQYINIFNYLNKYYTNLYTNLLDSLIDANKFKEFTRYLNSEKYNLFSAIFTNNHDILNLIKSLNSKRLNLLIFSHKLLNLNNWEYKDDIKQHLIELISKSVEADWYDYWKNHGSNTFLNLFKHIHSITSNIIKTENISIELNVDVLDGTLPLYTKHVRFICQKYYRYINKQRNKDCLIDEFFLCILELLGLFDNRFKELFNVFTMAE